MLPKYLFADVDDTFTVSGGLCGEVLAAVERAQQAGIEVILNTGRPAGFGAALFAYLPTLAGVIVENGGAWLDRGGTKRPHGHEPDFQFAYPIDKDLRSRLEDLQQRVAFRLGREQQTTADNRFRLTDYTVLRDFPTGNEGKTWLREISRLVDEESNHAGQLLASSIHLHFSLDGANPRSKASGAEKLLASRGIEKTAETLASCAVAVGDSANDASFFVPGRFALSVGVRNIVRYLPELGDAVPMHVTQESEGLGLCELVADLLDGRLGI
jgi:hydroxymethylpyrimidine pyrophosphatase-like HAD family hydrolase